MTDSRIRALRDVPPEPHGRFILYWMTSARRPAWNFALDRAVEIARELGKPLVVLEALRADSPYASDRFHRFVIEGMRANERAFARTSALYHPFIEERRGAGKGLLRALSREACAVVADDHPGFFFPRMLARAAEVVTVRFEAVDSNGLLPIRATPKSFARAYDFRRFLARELAPHLERVPRAKPLARLEIPRLRSLPSEIVRRWPRASAKLLSGDVSALPIDHSIAPVELEGGFEAGARALRRFVRERLERYVEDRNEPGASSGLSPYLHFGHVSAHEVFASAADATDFVDQLVTWRELGFNACVHESDPTSYASIPKWARRTLEEHARDPRKELYTRTQLENGETADELWNAAQNELRIAGTIPNYLRMLWGKKVFEWSATPRSAHATLFHLNDRYALDGRDPNSATGIQWIFGKYDRPWGPTRPIFGTVRYMSSASARRKLDLEDYVRRWTNLTSAAASPSPRRAPRRSGPPPRPARP
jgi:deoxyribodipyrimidine photo-lyase